MRRDRMANLLLRAHMVPYLMGAMRRHGNLGDDPTRDWLFGSLLDTGEAGDLLALVEHLNAQHGQPRPFPANRIGASVTPGLLDGGAGPQDVLHSLLAHIAGQVQTDHLTSMGERYDSPNVHREIARRLRLPAPSGLSYMTGYNGDATVSPLERIGRVLGQGATPRLTRAVDQASGGHPRDLLELHDALMPGNLQERPPHLDALEEVGAVLHRDVLPLLGLPLQ